MRKNTINISLNSIEGRAVQYLQEAKQAKTDRLRNDEVKKELYEYIFGNGENPFEDINDRYNKKMEELYHRTDKSAKSEKNNYLGKSKKGVKSIKKIAEQVSKEV